MGQGLVQPVQAKVWAVEQFPLPTTKNLVIKMLNMCGLLFVSRLSRISRPFCVVLQCWLPSHVEAGAV